PRAGLDHGRGRPGRRRVQPAAVEVVRALPRGGLRGRGLPRAAPRVPHRGRALRAAGRVGLPLPRRAGVEAAQALRRPRAAAGGAGARGAAGAPPGRRGGVAAAGAGPLSWVMDPAEKIEGAGSLTRTGNGYRVAFRRAYARPLADLWQAISAPEGL